MTTEAVYRRGTEVIAQWRGDVVSGKAPVLYPVGSGAFSRIEVGPGLVTLVGGAPGSGKTALTMQLAIDALRLTPTLRVCVVNVEMAPEVLLDRQLARLSGVDLTTIRHRKLGPQHADRIGQAMATLEALGGRLCFVQPPFGLDKVAAAVDDAMGAGSKHVLILIDYLQRIPPQGTHGDKRGAVDDTMSRLREYATTGAAVIVVSAVARTKDSRGRSSYDGAGLNLASFRESSELEFGADDAFILVPNKDDADGMVLRHLKSRHGEAKDLTLTFDRRHQRFTPWGVSEAEAEAANLDQQLRALWDNTAPAAEDEGANE